MGGASSHDIKDGILKEDNWREKAKELNKQGKYMYRVKNLSWWNLELPTKAELAHGREVLQKANYDQAESSMETFEFAVKNSFVLLKLKDYVSNPASFNQIRDKNYII